MPVIFWVGLGLVLAGLGVLCYCLATAGDWSDPTEEE